ncbi:hypothetical protein ACWEPC_07255, partial [Nonomuraea sp. NPDC004297]
GAGAGGGLHTDRCRGGLGARSHPNEPPRSKFRECVIYSTACDITDAANDIAAEGRPVDLDDLATISPYITHAVRRFGNWTLDLAPPAQTPVTRLDLEPRVLFAT